MTNYVDATYTQDRLNDGRTTIVNVLSKDQFAERHIPGSINVPLEEPDFEARIQQALPDKDRPVIVHCSSNDCQSSTKAARKLESLGYKDVRDFKAGLQGWEEAGQRFEGAEHGVLRPARPAPGQEREVNPRAEENLMPPTTGL